MLCFAIFIIIIIIIIIILQLKLSSEEYILSKKKFLLGAIFDESFTLILRV